MQNVVEIGSVFLGDWWDTYRQPNLHHLISFKNSRDNNPPVYYWVFFSEKNVCNFDTITCINNLLRPNPFSYPFIDPPLLVMAQSRFSPPLQEIRTTSSIKNLEPLVLLYYLYTWTMGWTWLTYKSLTPVGLFLNWQVFISLFLIYQLKLNDVVLLMFVISSQTI